MVFAQVIMGNSLPRVFLTANNNVPQTQNAKDFLIRMTKRRIVSNQPRHVRRQPKMIFHGQVLQLVTPRVQKTGGYRQSAGRRATHVSRHVLLRLRHGMPMDGANAGWAAQIKPVLRVPTVLIMCVKMARLSQIVKHNRVRRVQRVIRVIIQQMERHVLQINVPAKMEQLWHRPNVPRMEHRFAQHAMLGIL